jgi:hypothetical protein
MAYQAISNKIKVVVPLCVSLITIGLISTGISGAEIDSSTCVGAWLFNEVGGDVARDASSNENHGQLMNGPRWGEAGRFGKALKLDGDDDYVEVLSSPSLDITEKITLLGWVKPEAFGIEGTCYRRILEKTNPTGDAVYMLYFDEGHPAFAINDPDNKGSTAWSATVLVPIGEWSHLAGTFDGETLKIFFDGVESASKAFKGNIKSTTTSVGIGIAKIPSSDGNFKGLLDEVAIFNVALGENDIKKIMDDGLEETVGLTAVSPAGKLTATWAQIKSH